MRNLQPADECEYRDILTAIGKLGHLALKVANKGLEALTLPYFDREEVVVVFLGFSQKAY